MFLEVLTIQENIDDGVYLVFSSIFRASVVVSYRNSYSVACLFEVVNPSLNVVMPLLVANSFTDGMFK